MIVDSNHSRYVKPYMGELVNWCHPLARGLGYWWSFNEQTGVPMSLRESIFSKQIPQAYQADGAGTWVAGGMRVNDGGLKGPRLFGCNWTTSASLAIQVTIESVTGAAPALVSKRNASGATGWNFQTNAGNVVMAYGSSVFLTFTGADPGLGEHMFVVTYQASDTALEWHLYVDGFLAGTLNDARVPPLVADSVYVNLGVRWPGDTTYMTGIVHMLGFWVDNALTSGDARELWHNPYSIFEFPEVVPAVMAAIDWPEDETPLSHTSAAVLGAVRGSVRSREER